MGENESKATVLENMIKNLKSVISLTLICAVVSVLLAFTNDLTAPIIKEQESAAVNKALSVVLPGGSDFSPVEIGEYELPETITEMYTSSPRTYASSTVSSVRSAAGRETPMRGL